MAMQYLHGLLNKHNKMCLLYCRKEVNVNMKKEKFETPVAEVTKFSEAEITMNGVSFPEIGLD